MYAYLNCLVFFNPLTPTELVKPPFVIFDIRAAVNQRLRHVRVPGCQKLQMAA